MKKTILTLALTLSSFAAMADYRCAGTEPFWGGTITSNNVTMTTLGESQLNEKIESLKSARGYVSDVAFIVKTKNSTSTLVKESCNDGMSDKVWSHHIVFDDGTTVLYGCCSVAK